MIRFIITTLVRLYPVTWRREYGAELSDMLAARPLNAAIIGDVLWTGLRERIRVAKPATLVGLAMMLVVLSGFVWNMRAGGLGWAALLHPSGMTLPTVIVKPFLSAFYLLVISALGCWVNMRPGARWYHSGRAAVKVSFFAGIPVILAGVSMMFGLLSAPTIGPQHYVLTPLEVICAPLFALPTAWIWGTIGGLLGGPVSCFRRGSVISR
jgi:hypothetical protein